MRIAKMRIHIGRTGKEGVEPGRPNRNHQRQANRPPHRIAPAHPILEPEDAGRINAEGRRFVRRRGHGGKLRRRIGHLARHPDPCRFGIGHRLDRGESLGRHDDQRRFRIQQGKRIRDMRPVHVADEMTAWPIMERGERQRRHRRPQIGPADADVHHIGDHPALPREPACPHIIGKGRQPGMGRAQVGRHIPAIDENGGVHVAQHRVQHGAAFGFIDLFA